MTIFHTDNTSKVHKILWNKPKISVKRPNIFNITCVCVGITNSEIVSGNLSSCAFLLRHTYNNENKTFVNEMPFELPKFILSVCVQYRNMMRTSLCAVLFSPFVGMYGGISSEYL